MAFGWWARLLSMRFVAGYSVAIALAACGVSSNSLKGPAPKIDEVKRQAAEAKPRGLAAPRKDAAPSEAPSPSVEKAKSWEEAARLLPKDKAGNVDWVRALELGAIVPRQSLEPTAPGYLELDLEVDLTSSKSKMFWVTFPHEAHAEWLKCKSCHSRLFPLRRGSEPPEITMAKIKAGRYCGSCHGDVSFGVKDECARCHTRVPATSTWRPSEEPPMAIERARTWDEAAKLVPVTDGLPDWAKALADGVIAPRPGIDPKVEPQPLFPFDVERVPADNPVFKAVFPHGPHTAVLACANCHFGIFQMAKGAAPITMEKIYKGEYCGQCHGKVAFAVLTGCPRCHPLMRGQ